MIFGFLRHLRPECASTCSVESLSYSSNFWIDGIMHPLVTATELLGCTALCLHALHASSLQHMLIISLSIEANKHFSAAVFCRA